jgi:1-acyl-sn-glycerol-3-phosphate acyltransferase
MGTKRKKRIYERNIYYTVLKYYAGLFFRLSYGKREYYGIKNLTSDGALIFAPNHTNALMDGLAVLDLDTRPKVFLARADIFKKPLLAKIFFFLRIMPINRIRDGRNTLKNNDETIKRSAEVLCNNVPFVILPEGAHRPMHSLLPLGKGIFRIALLANKEIAGEKPVYIVPIGIEYGNFFRYRSSLLLQIGHPLNVTAYVQANPEKDEPAIMNDLKEKLQEDLKELILYIPDDAHYDATLELCNMSCHDRIEQLSLRHRVLKNRLTANRYTVKLIQNRLEADPENTVKILDEIAVFAEKRKRKRISMASVVNPNPGITILYRSLLLLLLFPCFVVSSILYAPTLLASYLLCLLIEDPTFHNSVRYVATLLLWTITYVAFTITVFSLFEWEFALALSLVFLPSPLTFYQYFKWFRTTRSDIIWILAKDLRNAKKRFVEWIL